MEAAEVEGAHLEPKVALREQKQATVQNALFRARARAQRNAPAEDADKRLISKLKRE